MLCSMMTRHNACPDAWIPTAAVTSGQQCPSGCTPVLRRSHPVNRSRPTNAVTCSDVQPCRCLRLAPSAPCAGCKPGYTYVRKGCHKCAAGTFKKAAGNGRCAHCAGNTYSKAGATKCRSASDDPLLHTFTPLPGLA